MPWQRGRTYSETMTTQCDTVGSVENVGQELHLPGKCQADAKVFRLLRTDIREKLGNALNETMVSDMSLTEQRGRTLR